MLLGDLSGGGGGGGEEGGGREERLRKNRSLTKADLVPVTTPQSYPGLADSAWAGWLAGSLAVGWFASGLADWLAGWLTDWLTGWLTDWLTGWRCIHTNQTLLTKMAAMIAERLQSGGCRSFFGQFTSRCWLATPGMN